MEQTTYALETYQMTYRGDRRKKHDPELEHWQWSSHHEFDNWDQAMDCVAEPDWAPDIQFRIRKITRHIMTTGRIGDYNQHKKYVKVYLKDSHNMDVVVDKRNTYEEMIEVINQRIGTDQWVRFEEIKT
jgi:hypothetical protein